MNTNRWMALCLGSFALLATTAVAWTAQDDPGSAPKPASPAPAIQPQDQAKPSDHAGAGEARPGAPAEAPGRLRRLERQDDDAPVEPRRFQDPDDLFAEMERMMRGLDHGWPGMRGLFDGHPFEFRFLDDDAEGAPSYGPGTNLVVQQQDDKGSRKLELKVKENGEVVADITRDGKTEKIEAKSFEDFRATHGDVLREFGVAAGPRLKGKLPDAGPHSGLQPLPGPNVPGSGPRLGVRVSPISEDLAAYLDLEEGVGLMVREVVPDSLAARLGVKVNDVIAEVDGEPVTSTDVIARALRSKGEVSLSVVVIRKANRVVLRTAT
ncbi:MAG: PDZ domain-containing protein [Planctomycetota bacterium]